MERAEFKAAMGIICDRTSPSGGHARPHLKTTKKISSLIVKWPCGGKEVSENRFGSFGGLRSIFTYPHRTDEDNAIDYGPTFATGSSKQVLVAFECRPRLEGIPKVHKLRLNLTRGSPELPGTAPVIERDARIELSRARSIWSH